MSTARPMTDDEAEDLLELYTEAWEDVEARYPRDGLKTLMDRCPTFNTWQWLGAHMFMATLNTHLTTDSWEDERDADEAFYAGI